MKRQLRTIINEKPFVALIGDVHAGRKFKTNVPLNRVGDREASLYHDLGNALQCYPHHETHLVIMGDLFDKFQVDNNTLLRVFNILDSAATDEVFVHILNGNHDLSRDLTLVSSFDVLKNLCMANNHIFFYDQDRAESILVDKDLVITALPYSATVSATEMAETVRVIENRPHYVLGHWDLTAHGEDTHNLIPAEVLARKGVTKVYTGHIHKPQTVTLFGLPVQAVGSLQPYAHGEELEGETLYQTLLKDEVEELLAENENHFEDVNLRVLVASGEAWVEAVPNCLSFQVKMLAADADDLADLEVGYEEFSTANILNKNLVGVSENLVGFIHERIEHYKSLEN